MASLSSILDQIELTKRMTTRTFHFICLIVGISSFGLLLISLAAPVFLPPISPTWTAEKVVQYYREHYHDIQAGAACLILASAGYSTLVALNHSQLEPIPNVPKAALVLQLISGTGIACRILISCFFVAIAVFRSDGPAELTQMLNDMFWLCFTLPPPLLQVQSFANAWAVPVDNRP